MSERLQAQRGGLGGVLVRRHKGRGTAGKAGEVRVSMSGRLVNCEEYSKGSGLP